MPKKNIGLRFVRLAHRKRNDEESLVDGGQWWENTVSNRELLDERCRKMNREYPDLLHYLQYK